jgi:hypothetical protein
MQEAAKALAAARDQAKPQDVRDREMRNRFRTMQDKLEANVKRKSALETDIQELEGKLAKQKEALFQLETVCSQQDRKVRELHAALGTVRVDSESDGSDADMEDGPATPTSRRKDGWGLVGTKGKVKQKAALSLLESPCLDQDKKVARKVATPPTFTAAELAALAVLRGAAGAAKAGESKATEGRRSRSPPGQKAGEVH